MEMSQNPSNGGTISRSHLPGNEQYEKRIEHEPGDPPGTRNGGFDDPDQAARDALRAGA